jgi:hypothetical protein
MKDAKNKKGHSVKILGRSGILYNDGYNKYFIDSEILIDKYFDLVIYSNSIRYYNIREGNMLTEERKREIVLLVKELLETKGIKIDIQ